MPVRRPAPTVPARGGLVTAALAGLVHGPAEIVPVSSSAHVALIVALTRRRPPAVGLAPGGRPAREAEMVKTLEVAVHAGTLVGLALGLRRDIAGGALGLAARPRPAVRCLGLCALATGPAVAAGLVLERPIERRLGGPGTIAVGLVAGGLVMAAADRGDAGGRPVASSGPADAAVVGLAQAAALWPGVSRSGATMAAARLRGFSRPAAAALSAGLAVPAVLGATSLKGARLARRARAGELPRGRVGLLAVAALAAAASGRAVVPLARRARRGVRLGPLAVYRTTLAAATLAAGHRRAVLPRSGR